MDFKNTGQISPDLDYLYGLTLDFNQELNIISELDLSSLEMKNSANYFTRKGKLYFLNKETEDLEFFVFDLNPTISNE